MKIEEIKLLVNEYKVENGTPMSIDVLKYIINEAENRFTKPEIEFNIKDGGIIIQTSEDTEKYEDYIIEEN